MTSTLWTAFFDELEKLGGLPMPKMPKITPPPTIPPKGFNPAIKSVIEQGPIPTVPAQQMYVGMNKIPINKQVGIRPGMSEMI